MWDNPLLKVICEYFSSWSDTLEVEEIVEFEDPMYAEDRSMDEGFLKKLGRYIPFNPFYRKIFQGCKNLNKKKLKKFFLAEKEKFRKSSYCGKNLKRIDSIFKIPRIKIIKKRKN